MNKEIKDFIASNKLSDEDILRLLKADSSDADKDQNDTDQEDTAETDSAEGQKEDQTGEEDAPDQEQPDIRELVQKLVAEELAKLKGGKTAPKVKPKPKTVTAPFDFTMEFGSL